MAKKMYYTEEETAEKLGVTPDAVASFVRDQKLRVFMDGGRKMFKAVEVDALAGAAEGSMPEIELSPADTAADSVSLSEADVARPPTKEDTVITAEGISIFDDEDLEIEADPMAKTQIAPSIEDQTSLDGVGSGSGLLDLTRESDDTSLGDVGLDQIDMEGAVGEGIAEDIPEPQPYAPPLPEVVVEAPTETTDAGSGAFGGVAVGTALVSLVMGAVALAAIQGVVPSFVLTLKDNIAFLLIGSIVVIVIAAVLGLVMGKAVAARQAMRRMGG